MKQVAKPKIFRSGSYLAHQQTDDFPATISPIVQGLILPSMSLMSTKGFSVSQATHRREVEMLGTVVLAPLSNLPLSNSTYPYQTYLYQLLYIKLICAKLVVYTKPLFGLAF